MSPRVKYALGAGGSHVHVSQTWRVCGLFQSRLESSGNFNLFLTPTPPLALPFAV